MSQPAYISQAIPLGHPPVVQQNPHTVKMWAVALLISALVFSGIGVTDYFFPSSSISALLSISSQIPSLVLMSSGGAFFIGSMILGLIYKARQNRQLAAPPLPPPSPVVPPQPSPPHVSSRTPAPSQLRSLAPFAKVKKARSFSPLLSPSPVPPQPSPPHVSSLTPTPSQLQSSAPPPMVKKSLSFPSLPPPRRPLPPFPVSFQQANPFNPLIQKLRARNQTDPLTDIELSRLFSECPLDFNQKKIVIFVKDLSGYGDSACGLKILNILRRRLHGAILTFACDNPWKAVELNDQQYNHEILIPKDLISPNTLTPEKTVQLIDEFSPHFLIVGPVTSFNSPLLQQVKNDIPHLLIREYGFGGRSYESLEDNEYVSGPTSPYVGMVVNQELNAWASSKTSQDPIARLKNLRSLPPPIFERILVDDEPKETSAGDKSTDKHAKFDITRFDEYIAQFNEKSSLFCAYSSDINSRISFLLAVAREHFQLLHSKKELCFFFIGPLTKEMEEFPTAYRAILEENGVGSVKFLDFNNKTVKEVVFDKKLPGKVRLLFSALQPSDTLQIIKSSEQEMLTTGDQSWSEGISANKHWIQERLMHKRLSLEGVLKAADTYASRGKSFSSFRDLLKAVYQKKPYVVIKHRDPVTGLDKVVFDPATALYKQQADLLFAARSNPAIAEAWSTLNHELTNHTIEDWLIGKMIWNVLEKARPDLFREAKGKLHDNTFTVADAIQLFQSLS